MENINRQTAESIKRIYTDRQAKARRAMNSYIQNMFAETEIFGTIEKLKTLERSGKLAFVGFTYKCGFEVFKRKITALDAVTMDALRDCEKNAKSYEIKDEKDYYILVFSFPCAKKVYEIYIPVNREKVKNPTEKQGGRFNIIQMPSCTLQHDIYDTDDLITALLASKSEIVEDTATGEQITLTV